MSSWIFTVYSPAILFLTIFMLLSNALYINYAYMADLQQFTIVDNTCKTQLDPWFVQKTPKQKSACEEAALMLVTDRTRWVVEKVMEKMDRDHFRLTTFFLFLVVSSFLWRCIRDVPLLQPIATWVWKMSLFRKLVFFILLLGCMTLTAVLVGSGLLVTGFPVIMTGIHIYLDFLCWIYDALVWTYGALVWTYAVLVGIIQVCRFK